MLDFLNSIAAPVDGPMDFLLNSDTLSRWLAESGVMQLRLILATQRFSPIQLSRIAPDA